MTGNLAVSILAFLGALVATLVLTPLARGFNAKIGMIDYPDARRINTRPVPRGGGVAIFIGVFSVFALLHVFFAVDMPGHATGRFLKISLLTFAITAVGYVDDKYSLRPLVKLSGQVAVAALTWWWTDLGFRDLWPNIPAWLDCLATVAWIVGAVNAFNLIDGLDGLAAGLGLVAVVGMAGALCFAKSVAETSFYFAFAGGLAGFLRYNYNPASVFLGDSGSMMIGYLLSVLPLCSHVSNSFMVSIGVPLLAMGVPVFDTFLAIVRRSIRKLLPGGSGSVMTADRDHLHHRVLRSMGLNQRHAALALYGAAAVLVAIAIGGMVLKTKSGGMWLLAIAVFTAVVFRDMARVEFFDFGLLLDNIAHSGTSSARRLRARLAVPILALYDIVAISAAYYVSDMLMQQGGAVQFFRSACLLRVVCMFACLAFFRAYTTAWSRATNANYVRLFLGCMFGSALSSAVIYYLPGLMQGRLSATTVLFATVSFVALAAGRLVRSLARDIFYEIDCARVVARKDVSRILIYGAGLRYQAFHREFVRKVARNTSVIVGIIDDDIFLRGQYVGDMKVYGTLMDAPEIINRLNVDTVVVAFEVEESWLRVVKDALAGTGVRIKKFEFVETEVADGSVRS